MRVDIARIRSKAPKINGASGHSTPPARNRSASPARMERKASPIAIAAEVQESELALGGPVRLNSMAMLQEAEPLKTARARLGLIRRIPSRR